MVFIFLRFVFFVFYLGKFWKFMIDLSEHLGYLPGEKIRDLELVRERLVGTGLVEMIVLYGSYARGDFKLMRGVVQGKKSDYDLLVITNDEGKRKELQHLRYGLFEDIDVAVQLLVEEIELVNLYLKEAQYFFTDIKKEGKILFDTERYRLADAKDLTQVRKIEIAELNFREWFDNAKEFQHSSHDSLKRGSYNIASFNLQQCVENCYTAIGIVFTHYKPHEHCLKVLRERVLGFDDRIAEVLPYKTKEDQTLFNKLNYAYIGGRYISKLDFPVSEEELSYWGGEAAKLIALTEEVCRGRIEGMWDEERARRG